LFKGCGEAEHQGKKAWRSRVDYLMTTRKQEGWKGKREGGWEDEEERRSG
jgi:hypothetical protein